MKKRTMSMIECAIAMSNPQTDPCFIMNEEGLLSDYNLEMLPRLEDVKSRTLTENQKIKMDMAKEQEQIKAHLRAINTLVRLVESGKLESLKKEELYTLCADNGVKRTGNKSQLRHNLKDAYQEYVNVDYRINRECIEDFNFYPSVFGYIGPDDFMTIEEGQNYIAEYVAENNSHVGLTIGVVKSIARRDIEYMGTPACRDIVFDHFDKYKQPIFDDMKQEVYFELLRRIRENVVEIKNGRVLPFDGISYGFAGVYNTLNQYKERANDRARRGEGGTTEDGQSYKNGGIPLLAKSVCLADILENENLKTFLRFVARTERQDTAERMVRVLALRIQGNTQEQTAEIMGVSARTVRNYESKLRIDYILYGEPVAPAHDAIDTRDYGIKFGSSVSGISSSYEYEYSDTMTGYSDMTVPAQAVKRGNLKPGETVNVFHGGIKAEDKSDKYRIDPTRSAGRLEAWEVSEVRASATYDRKSAEKRNNALLSGPNGAYYRKHNRALVQITNEMK